MKRLLSIIFWYIFSITAYASENALTSFVEFHFKIGKDQYYVEEETEITPSVIANKVRIKGEYYVYIFTDKDRNHVFVGSMYDASGFDVFKSFQNSAMTPSLSDFNTSHSYNELVKVFDYVNKNLEGIQLGNKNIKKVNAIVFLNPNSPTSEKIWELIKLNGVKFKFKVIIVGKGSEDEIRTLNAIYRSKSKYRAIEEWFGIYSKKPESKIAFRNKGVGKPEPMLTKSNKVMESIGIKSTPYFLFIIDDKLFYSGGFNEAVIKTFFTIN